MLRKLRRERNNIFYKKLHLALALASAMRYKVSVATNKEAHTMRKQLYIALATATVNPRLHQRIQFAALALQTRMGTWEQNT